MVVALRSHRSILLSSSSTSTTTTPTTPTKKTVKFASSSSPKSSASASGSTLRRRVVSGRLVHAPAYFMDQFDLYYPTFASAFASAAKKRRTAATKKAVAVALAPSLVATVAVAAAATPRRVRVARPARPAPIAALGAGAAGGMGVDPIDAKKGVFHYPAKLRENSPAATVEICFSFDTTGSMSSYIDTVKREINQLVTQLTTDVPDLRIGIIAHGDYCDERTYVLKRLDLSNDRGAIETFVQGVTRTGGGDGDECYELVLLDAQSFSWTPTSSKALVVIGDAAPHKPHEYRKINWRTELDALKGMGVRVYGVQCGTLHGEAPVFYETISNETGGKVLELKNIQEINAMIMGLCYREAAQFHMETGPDQFAGVDGPVLRLPAAAAAAVANGDAAAGAISEVERLDILAVHKAIHFFHDSVQLPSNNTKHKISVGNFGCRFVKIGEMTYIEQNKEEGSRYAQMAAEGKHITWMVRNGEWGCIMDDSITAAKPEVEPVLNLDL